MSWVTVLWSCVAGVCITLGALHFMAWCWNRAARANLYLAGTALGIAMVAVMEWTLMHAESPGEYLKFHRWGHVATFFALLGMVGFVQTYFGTGRLWLAWLVVALRLLVVILAFVPGPTFNFREITALVPFEMLGERVVVAQGLPTPWARLGEASLLLVVGFVADAAVRLWRKGGRRQRQRALVVGGAVLIFFLACLVNAILVHTGANPMPYFISFSFMWIVLAMGFELSLDLVDSVRIAEQLHENAEIMRLAADAAQLAMWRWDMARDVIWVSPGGRTFYGVPAGEDIDFDRFLATLHPEDREEPRAMVARAVAGDGVFRAEYRVVLPDGGLRWILARGRIEKNGGGSPVMMRGVSIDVTERKRIEMEAGQLRGELMLLTRAATLSEISGSLAHELNQPLAIILSNAQAAQRLLERQPPDLEELRAILSDIVAEDSRAAEVIRRLRKMLGRGATEWDAVPLDDAIGEVLHLAQADLAGRGIAVTTDLMSGRTLVSGDRVQIQQVVLNLMLNGADAMADSGTRSRRLSISSRAGDGVVRVSVRDEGCGLPPEVEKIFEHFFTTKSHGLGMGLAICRSIITGHHGRLWCESNRDHGAVFHFELPILQTVAQ